MLIVPPTLSLEHRPESHLVFEMFFLYSLADLNLCLLPLSLNILSSGQDVPEGGHEAEHLG